MNKKIVIAFIMVIGILSACGKETTTEVPEAILTEQEKPQDEVADKKDEVEAAKADVGEEKANTTLDDAPKLETIEEVAYANQLLQEENGDGYEKEYLIMYICADTSVLEQPDNTSLEIAKLKKGSAVAVWSQDSTGQWAVVTVSEKDGYVDKNLLVKDKEESLKAETGKTTNTSPQEQQSTEVPEQTTQPTPDTEVQAPAETQPPQEQPPQEQPSQEAPSVKYSDDPQEQAIMEQLARDGLIGPPITNVDNPDYHEDTEEEKEYWDKWLEEFNKEHPNITVG